MLVDLNTLESGQNFHGDLVIVGAGAAGITLALQFVGTSHQVTLVESGNLDLDADTQALDEGAVVGLPYEPLVSARARYFGGTTNMWTGWCKPLDRIDLQPRPWLDLEGWPVARETLQPFYERAQPIVEVGPYRYDLAQWTGDVGMVDDFSSAGLQQSFWQKSPPTRFGEHYREQLATADNITVLLNANLVALETSGGEAQTVDSIELRSLVGKSARARATRFVLACGGMENARVLLAASASRPRGLGNDHDLVGRYFMEHPWFEVGTVFPQEPYTLVDRYFVHERKGVRQRSGWNYVPEEQKRLQVQNCCAELRIGSYQERGIAAAGKMWRELRHGRLPSHVGEQTLKVLADLGGIAESVWRKEVLHRMINKPPEQLLLVVNLDSRPDPDSRVTLDTERDALGIPRIRLDWRLSASDERSMLLLAGKVAEELTRAGHGRVRLHPALADPAGGWARAGNLIGQNTASDAPVMHVSWHHMGTTRMATTPQTGVVDADCRVHGTGNLYIAGSSVFPTVGNANPTLTIVALALRLGDHLKEAFASGRS